MTGRQREDDVEARVLPGTAQISGPENADEGHEASRQVEQEGGVRIEAERVEHDGRERRGDGRTRAAEERENDDPPELILEEGLADLIELDVLVLGARVVHPYALDEQDLLLLGEALGTLGESGKIQSSAMPQTNDTAPANRYMICHGCSRELTTWASP